VSHHVSHFLLIARHRKFYDEHHLSGSIAALERLRENIDESETGKVDDLLKKLKSIDVNVPVDLSLLTEIQSALKEIPKYKV